jgi:hypothetical protein
MCCGAAGMIAMLGLGNLLDHLDTHAYGGLPVGFGVTFISAILFGMISLHFLKRISEPEYKNQMASPHSIGVLIYLPLRGCLYFLSLLSILLFWVRKR